MATTIKLEGEARSEFGKGVARRLRVANKIFRDNFLWKIR